jgi:hypothetical protein
LLGNSITLLFIKIFSIKTSIFWDMKPVCFMLLPCLAYSSTLKAIYSSEMSINFRRATQCYIPEDKNSVTTAMRT